jgi:alpha-D-ribose 1-methylphosphonate 5-phosphate C-P lyase
MNAESVPGYNYAYLDEQTKGMIRRAILKAVAIPGYQVPFGSREMPLPYGWGTGGIQITAAVIGPDDVLKVIDQGADDTTNAVSIRSFFARTAQVTTTTATEEATVIQTRHRIPEAALRKGQILVYQVPIPEPLRFMEPSESETRTMHALEEYGVMHVRLYEDIAEHGRIQLQLSRQGRGSLHHVPVSHPQIRQSQDGRLPGPATFRRGPRKTHLRHSAPHQGQEPGLRGSSLRNSEMGRGVRHLRLRQQFSR